MKSRILLIITTGLFLLFTANSCKKDKLVKPNKATNSSFSSPSDSYDNNDDKKFHSIWQINDDEDEPLERQ